MKTKRLRALLLLMVMTVNIFAEVSVHAADYKIFVNQENEVYAKMLDKFGIYSFYNEDGVFFNDTNGVKRGEAAKALISLLGYESVGGGSVSHLFIDVPDYHEYATDISAAVNMGLMVGTEPGLFEPDSVIKVEHFIKMIVKALGYEYRAQIFGGYPLGYVSVAAELGLLKGIDQTVDQDLSREALIRFLYNSLDVKLPGVIEVSEPNIHYSPETEDTVLSRYHKIYHNEGIVQTSELATLNSYYEPSDETVIIGKDKLKVGETTDVFNYLGYEVKYYYKVENEEISLVWLEETDNNEVYKFTSHDIEKVEGNEITFYEEVETLDSITVDSNANVFYNGKLATENIENLFKTFADNITFICNDNNKIADIVFIEDYTYDLVEFVNDVDKKIYLSDHIIEYADKDYVSARDASGAKIEIPELPVGCVVGFGDISGDELVLKVLSAPSTVTISAVSDGEVIIDGKVHKLHKKLGTKMTALIEPGKSVLIALNENLDIVFVKSTDDTMKIGFLIKVTENNRRPFESIVGCNILGTDGIVTKYTLEDKITIDDTKMKKEEVRNYLKQVKEKLNTKTDGETAQVVYYQTDENGVLKKLYTAGFSEDSTLKLVYNCNERGSARLRDHGYGNGVFANAYPLTKGIKVFKIPETNIEKYEDKYFQITDYGLSGAFNHNELYNIDFYKKNQTDILPVAAVVYGSSGEAEVTTSAKLFLVQKALHITNDEGEPTVKLVGIYDGESKEFLAAPEVVMPELTAGDACLFSLDQLDVIVACDKVYDFETDTIVSHEVIRSGELLYDGVAMLHIYNAPVNSLFIEAFETDFSLGVPGDDKKHLVNTGYGISTQSKYTFDTDKKKAKPGVPDRIIDYMHDPAGYTRVLIRFGAAYQMESIFYE